MRHNKKTKCNTPYCKNNSYGRKFCSTCRCRAYRKSNPYRSAYNNLRASAVRRGIPFTITFEYFKRFARKYKYIKNKGSSGDSYTVDRRKNKKGYVKGNLRVITRIENSRKGTRRLSYDWVTKTAVYY